MGSYRVTRSPKILVGPDVRHGVEVDGETFWLSDDPIELTDEQAERIDAIKGVRVEPAGKTNDPASKSGQQEG